MRCATALVEARSPLCLGDEISFFSELVVVFTHLPHSVGPVPVLGSLLKETVFRPEFNPSILPPLKLPYLRNRPSASSQYFTTLHPLWVPLEYLPHAVLTGLCRLSTAEIDIATICYTPCRSDQIICDDIPRNLRGRIPPLFALPFLRRHCQKRRS